MGKKKATKETKKPCRFFGDTGVFCAHPDTLMRSEKYSEGEGYDTIPEREDCIACLLANVLMRLGADTFVAFMKTEK